MTSTITVTTHYDNWESDSCRISFSYPLKSRYAMEDADNIPYPYIPKYGKKAPMSLHSNSQSHEGLDRERWPTGYSPGYVTISSVLKRQRTLSETSKVRQSDAIAINKLQNSFWLSSFPSLGVLSKRSKSSSISEETFEANTSSSSAGSDTSSSCLAIASTESSTCSSYPFQASLGSKILSSIRNLSLPKIPKRSWWCHSCKRPKDSCQCINMCNIL